MYYLTTDGATAFFPAAWTDAGPEDPFVEAARGQAIARIEDLLELAKITAKGVKENMPEM